MLAIRRRASSLPRLCGRSTSIGCDIRLIQWQRIQSFSSSHEGLSFRRCVGFASFCSASRQSPEPSRRPGCLACRGSRQRLTSPSGRTSLATAIGTSAARGMPARSRAFNDYLDTYGVGGVVPTWQLLRTASDWQKCGAQPFEIPRQRRLAKHDPGAALHPRQGDPGRSGPSSQCRCIATHAQPMRWRARRKAPTVSCRRSTWCRFRPVTRDALMQRLCAAHARSGEGYGVGLGF